MSKSGYEDYMENERLCKAREPNTVCVNIWTPQLKIIDKIVKYGYFHSRSELIRRLIDRYLDDYLDRMILYGVITPEQIKQFGD